MPPGYGVACLVVLLVAAAGRAAPVQLKQLASRHYTVHTNLGESDAMLFARHMDKVFDEYQRRFEKARFTQRNGGTMPLFLFRTAGEYESHLESHGIPAKNTAGMFFFTQRLNGLATWVQGRPVTETMATLQHEGFHQFAFRYIGTDLPIWVNEGVAQYFEDGIVVGNRMHLNIAHGHRIATVKDAMASGTAIAFRRMLTMSDAEWASAVRQSPAKAALHYDQAWSMVHFLVTGDRGRYVDAFGDYLTRLGRGEESAAAFAAAFGSSDYDAFERAWRRSASEQEPDPVGLAAERLMFLGQAMVWLQENNRPLPSSTADLRRILQQIHYRATRVKNNVQVTFDAMDESMYRYPLPGRETTRMFTLFERERQDLLPRLSAPGVKPEPTLVWYRDSTNGQLFSDIAYR